jgi:hypothetical protein
VLPSPSLVCELLRLRVELIDPPRGLSAFELLRERTRFSHPASLPSAPDPLRLREPSAMRGLSVRRGLSRRRGRSAMCERSSRLSTRGKLSMRAKILGSSLVDPLLGEGEGRVKVGLSDARGGVAVATDEVRGGVLWGGEVGVGLDGEGESEVSIGEVARGCDVEGM